MIDLRIGRYQDVLSSTQADALICDPPYSERTHGGRGTDLRRGIDYTSWSDHEVEEFCAFWGPRVRGWWVVMTGYGLFSVWESALSSKGLYVFHPLPCVIQGMTVRLSGDGPASWCVWLIVARPRCLPYSRWGALPGAYHGPARGEPRRIGGKPLWLMDRIVRDYTREGDLIVDPCAGHATTLIAAARAGRRAVGSEVDADSHLAAMRRIEGDYHIEVGDSGVRSATARQPDLWSGR